MRWFIFAKIALKSTALILLHIELTRWKHCSKILVKFGDCEGYLNTVNTLPCSRNHFGYIHTAGLKVQFQFFDQNRFFLSGFHTTNKL